MNENIYNITWHILSASYAMSSILSAFFTSCICLVSVTENGIYTLYFKPQVIYCWVLNGLQNHPEGGKKHFMLNFQEELLKP